VGKRGKPRKDTRAGRPACQGFSKMNGKEKMGSKGKGGPDAVRKLGWPARFIGVGGLGRKAKVPDPLIGKMGRWGQNT